MNEKHKVGISIYIQNEMNLTHEETFKQTNYDTIENLYFEFYLKG